MNNSLVNNLCSSNIKKLHSSSGSLAPQSLIKYIGTNGEPINNKSAIDLDTSALVDTSQILKHNRLYKKKAIQTGHEAFNLSIQYNNLDNSYLNNDYSRYEGNIIHTSKLDITIGEDGMKCINQYRVKRQLGKGAFGKVKLVQSNQNDQYYAIKIINIRQIKVKMITRGNS